MDAAGADRRDALLELYDQALPEVYGYLLHRCGDVVVAEDLTSEVFLAAARSVSIRRLRRSRAGSLLPSCGVDWKPSSLDPRPMSSKLDKGDKQ